MRVLQSPASFFIADDLAHREAASPVETISLMQGQTETFVIPMQALGLRHLFVTLAGFEPKKDPLSIALVQVAAFAAMRRAVAFEKTGEGAASTGADAALTAREIECLNLLAIGMSDGQISDRTRISKRNVRFHVTNMKKKLEATSRLEAVHQARVRRLISA